MIRILSIIFFSAIVLFGNSCKNKEQESSISWYIAGELPPLSGQNKAIGVAGPVTGIHNNILLIAGGANFPDGFPWQGGKKKYYKEGFVYRQNSNDQLELIKKISLPFAIAYTASVSTPRGIVFAGGENKEGIEKKVFLLQWKDETDSLQIKSLPDLPIPIANAGITAIGENIYVLGGENTGSVSAGFFMLNITETEGQWQTLPLLPYPVSHTVVAAGPKEDSCVYLIGGRKKNPNGISELYNKVWRFDFTKQKWDSLQSLPYALSAGTGIAYHKELYLFGGDKGETFHKTEKLISDIQSAGNEQEKQQLIRSKNTLQKSHPGFSNEILSYHPLTNSWVSAGKIPFDVPATTTAVIWNDLVFIPSGEIKAGVRTAHILAARLREKD